MSVGALSDASQGAQAYSDSTSSTLAGFNAAHADRFASAAENR